MKQQRFNSEAIINIHVQETIALSIATLTDDFVCQICSKKHFLLNLVVTRRAGNTLFYLHFSPSVYFLYSLTIDKQV